MRFVKRTAWRQGLGDVCAGWLFLLLFVGCQAGPAPDKQPPKPLKAARPRARLRVDSQRAFGGNVGRINVMVVAGKGYTDLVRAHLPLFPLVVHITNAGEAPFALSRERDRFAIRTIAGHRIERTDLWQRGDWMTALAKLPAEFRSKFRYPDIVHPGAAVEFTVTFDTTIQPADLSGVEVALHASGLSGIKLKPIKTATEEQASP